MYEIVPSSRKIFSSPETYRAHILGVIPIQQRLLDRLRDMGIVGAIRRALPEADIPLMIRVEDFMLIRQTSIEDGQWRVRVGIPILYPQNLQLGISKLSSSHDGSKTSKHVSVALNGGVAVLIRGKKQEFPDDVSMGRYANPDLNKIDQALKRAVANPRTRRFAAANALRLA